MYAFNLDPWKDLKEFHVALVWTNDKFVMVILIFSRDSMMTLEMMMNFLCKYLKRETAQLFFIILHLCF